MGRPDFDDSASDSADGNDTGGTSLENAYFGADTPRASLLGVLNHADETTVGTVFGTRTENEDGAS